ncbi:MAG: nucleotidyltransferase family protein [Arenicella sp.]|nr:nucleotidyltransferase family protein [Arenicella sp.]
MSLNLNAAAEERDLKALAGLLLTGDQAELKISVKSLLAKLEYHGITLLAAEQQTLPSELKSHLAQLKAMMVANDKLKQIELASLFDTFSDQGLNAVLFKGSALAYSLYPKPWLRPRSDSDVLIAAKDKINADAILRQLGYQKLFAIQGKYVAYQSTYGKALAGDSFINIDLHWQINNRQMFSQTFTVKELNSNGARLTQFADTPLRSSVGIPGYVDSVLIASVHRLGHHHTEERLAWLYDIHLLVGRFTDQDWLELARRAKSKQICAITLDALKTAQHYLSTELDDEAMSQLETSASRFEASAIFLNRQLSEWHYFWADLKSMSDLKSKFGFLRESIVPSPDYVRQQMNTRWASIAYIKRFIRGLKRVF